MKTIFLFCIISIFCFSCRETKDEVKNAEVTQTTDSIDPMFPDEGNVIETDTTTAVINNATIAGVHPISLQWISWDKKGEAKLTPADSGWYNIDGSQLNDEREYLNIKGKIRRISERELEFDGIVETRIKMNNGGQPCIKEGKQTFFAKGNRTYYRLQNMENCAGGNLLDYVDIYAGTSGL